LAARSQLRRELGEGDLVFLNEPAAPMRQWAWLPLDRMHALETRLTTRSAGERDGAYFGEADHRFRSKPTSRFSLMATTRFADGDHRSARVRWASVSDLSV
jgi:hypothetical protein